MKETENLFFDSYDGIESIEDLRDRENFIQALMIEETSVGDTSLPPEEDIESLPSELAGRTLLKRDMRKAAIARMEAAARTEADFKEVIDAWDKEDANRERRERYHEVGRDESQVPLEYNMSKEGIVIPAPIHSVYWQQIMQGEFLETIFDCPYELHELVTDNDISNILKGLSEKHKALFFFLVVRGYSATKLACIYGQTDRNIRKVRATIERKIHKKLLPVLEERIRNNYGLTIQEREFVENHCKNLLSVV